MKLANDCSLYNETMNLINDSCSSYPVDNCESCYRFDICKDSYITEKAESLLDMFIADSIDIDKQTIPFYDIMVKVYKFKHQMDESGIDKNTQMIIINKTYDMINDTDSMSHEYKYRALRFLNKVKDKILERKIPSMSHEDYCQIYNSSRFNNGGIVIFTRTNSEQSDELMRKLEGIEYKYEDIDIVNILLSEKEWIMSLAAPIVLILGKYKAVDGIYLTDNFSIDDLVRIIKINKKVRRYHHG